MIRSKLHGAERREAILLGAAKAFRRSGFDATTVIDIASEARVSKTLVYRHFSTKQEIYEAILQSFSEKFTDTTLPDVEHADERTRLFMRLAKKHPDAFMLMFRHAVREPQFRQYAEGIEAKRIAYINHMLRGSINNPVKRRLRAELLCKTTTNIITIWVDYGCPDPEDMMNLILRVTNEIVETMKDGWEAGMSSTEIDMTRNRLH